MRVVRGGRQVRGQHAPEGKQPLLQGLRRRRRVAAALRTNCRVPLCRLVGPVAGGQARGERGRQPRRSRVRAARDGGCGGPRCASVARAREERGCGGRRGGRREVGSVVAPPGSGAAQQPPRQVPRGRVNDAHAAQHPLGQRLLCGWEGSGHHVGSGGRRGAAADRGEDLGREEGHGVAAVRRGQERRRCGGGGGAGVERPGLEGRRAATGQLAP